MTPEPGIWNKLTRVVIFLICLAGLSLLASKYFPLIQQNERMRKQIHVLESQMDVEQEKARQLREDIRLLTQDSAAIQREIRRKLGYTMPGEVIFRFPENESDLR